MEIVDDQKVVHVIIGAFRLFICLIYLQVVELIVLCQHTEAQFPHDVVILSWLSTVGYNLINLFLLTGWSFTWSFKVRDALTQKTINEIFKGCFFVLGWTFVSFLSLRNFNFFGIRSSFIKLLLINVIDRPQRASPFTLFCFYFQRLLNRLPQRPPYRSSDGLNIWRSVMPRESWNATPLSYKRIEFGHIVLRYSFLTHKTLSGVFQIFVDTTLFLIEIKTLVHLKLDKVYLVWDLRPKRVIPPISLMWLSSFFDVINTLFFLNGG